MSARLVPVRGKLFDTALWHAVWLRLAQTISKAEQRL